MDILEKQTLQNLTLGLCKKFKVSIYTIEEYRKFVVNGKVDDFDPIWKKSELLSQDFIDNTPIEHQVCFNYGIFTDYSVCSDGIRIINKELSFIPFYSGKAKDPERPLNHFDKKSGINKKASDELKGLYSEGYNIYIAILASGLTEDFSSDFEGIIQTVVKYETKPGKPYFGKIMPPVNIRTEKPSCFTVMDNIPEFNKYRTIF